MTNCRSKRWLRLLPAAVFLFAFPAEAHAHTPIHGVSEFINGLVHPLTTPSHVLIILGLAILAGQHPPLKAALKLPMQVFIPVSALALLATTIGWIIVVPPVLLSLLALALSILVSMGRPLPPKVAAALFGIAALALGLDSRVDSDSAMVVFKSLLGTWLSLGLLVADIAFYVSLCTTRHWMRIGLRVAGSWIAAISLLVLAFALKR